MKNEIFEQLVPKRPPPPEAGAGVVELENNPPGLLWAGAAEPNKLVPVDLVKAGPPKDPPKLLAAGCCPG